MPVITANTPLRDIVTVNPAAAQVFDGFDIDYFCRGGRPLGDALKEKNVSFDAFTGELARMDFGKIQPWSCAWNTAPLQELMAHIVDTYHEYLRTEMPTLEDSLAQIKSELVPSEHVFQDLRHMVHSLRRDLELQMRKEEAILFPAIAELAVSPLRDGPQQSSQFGSVANLSRVMGKDHEKVASVMHQIRLMTNNIPPPQKVPALKMCFDRLQSLSLTMHHHAHLEINILYPRAIELEKGKDHGSK